MPGLMNVWKGLLDCRLVPEN